MLTESKTKHHINMLLIAVFIPCLLLIMGNAAYAVPYLQLDANPAVYVGGEEESIVTTSLQFTLYALINNPVEPDLSGTFYLSGAVVPSISPKPPSPPDLGSIIFNGPTIPVVGGMVYGTPPIEVYLESQDLPSHGIFETYYFEREFTLAGATRTAVYNSQDNPGGPDPDDEDENGLLYYQAFNVDVRGLLPDYAIHFDLYTTKIIERQGKLVTVIDQYAPFSHDLLTAPVPGALLLGLLGMGVAGMKLRKYA